MESLTTKTVVLIILFSWCFLCSVNGQAVITDNTSGTFPSIDKCTGIGTETVTIVFPEADADGNAKVTLNLPAGVEYVCGSINSVGAVAIVDAGCVPTAPAFSVSGLSGAGSNVQFTFDIVADCTNNSGSNILSVGVADSGNNDCDPCFSNVFFEVNEASLLIQLTGGQAHANETGLVVGSTGDVDLSIINLGQGAVDNFTFCIDDPSGFIQTNSLMIGSTVLTGTTSGTETCFVINASDDPGNFGGDGLLSNSEVISLQRNYTVIGCSQPGGTINNNYSVSYGCNSLDCQSPTIRNGNFDILFGEPRVGHTLSTYQRTNTCTDHVIEVTYRNNGVGDATAAIAYNLMATTGLGGLTTYTSFDWSLTSIDLVVGASTIPMTFTGGSLPNLAQIDMSQFSSDPDGAGGLDDLDGDGQFDDLPKGQSFSFRVSYAYANGCPDVCNVSVDGPYDRYMFRMNYENQCGTSFVRQGVRAGVFDGGRILFSNNNYISPPNVGDGTIFDGGVAMNYYINSGQFACNAINGNQAIVQIEYTLPSEVSVSPTPNAQFNGAPAAFLNTSGSTVTVGGAFVPGPGGSDIRFNLDFEYACPGTSVDIPYEVTLICDPSCDCEIVVGCGIFSGASSCDSQACTDGGLTTSTTNLVRQTLGFTDASGATVVDPSTLSNTQLATILPCDSVQMSISGFQKPSTQFPAGFADNANVEFAYDLAGGGRIFEIGVGTFRVYDSASGTYSAPIALPVPSEVDFSGQHNVVWNLSSLLPSGIINDNDSILVDVGMVVLDNTFLPGNPIQLDGTSAGLFNVANATSNPLPGGDTRYSCGSLLLEAYPFRMNIRNDLGSTNFEGCASRQIEARWTVNTSLTYDPFPGEIRPYFVLDSFIIDLTGTGLILDPNETPYVVVRGTEADDSNYPYIEDFVPDVITSDRIVFINDGGTELPFTDFDFANNRVSLFAKVLPTCEANIDNSGGLFNTYALSSYYQTNTHSLNADCSRNETKTSVPLFTTEFPTVQLTEQTGLIVGDDDVECFDLRIRNNSVNLISNYVFLEVFDAVSGMTAIQANHVTTNGVAVDTMLNLLAYPEGHWIQVTEELPANDYYDIELCVQYDGCGLQTLTVNQGFDCASFPSPNPSVLSCNDNTLELSIQPVVAQAQGQLLSQPPAAVDPCGVYIYEVLVTSAGAANLIDPLVAIDLPTGISLTGASIAYPYNSSLGSPYTGTFEPATPVLNALGDTVRVFLSEHSGVMGSLPGGNNELTGEAPEEDRQALVRFVFEGDCDFSGGRQINFEGEGSAPCGTISSFDLTSTALSVNGINLDMAAEITLNLVDTVFSCEAKTLSPDLTYIDVVADGMPFVTGNTDTVFVTLPAGLQYVNGSYTGDDANSPTFVGTMMDGTSQVIAFAIPSGISIPDLGTIVTGFDFDVQYDISTTFDGTESINIYYQQTFPPLICPAEPGGICPNDAVVELDNADLGISGIIVSVDAGQDVTLCEGHTAYLGAYPLSGTVNSINDYTFSWSNGLGTDRTATVVVGANNVTYTVTVTDLNGCTATDQVTVISGANNAPDITCPSDQNAMVNTSDCEASVTLVDPTATDDCAPPTLTASNGVILNYYGSHNGHHYYITSQNVTPISNDASGISGTNTESEAMAAVQAAAQEFGADGYIATVDNAAENNFIVGAGYHYGNLVIGFTDELSEGAPGWFGACAGCGGAGSGYTNWNSGEPNNLGDEDYVSIQFPEGTWNDIDINQSIGEAIIEFNTMPEEVTIVCSPSTNSFPVGTTTVTCTATDWAGNMSSCDYDIIVTDDTDPVITPPSANNIEGCGISSLADYSETSVDISMDSVAYGYTVIEACAYTVTYIDVQVGTCPITITRTFTVTDASGNTDTETQTITIDDTTDPVITAPASMNIEACDITALTDYSETSVDITADAATYGYTVTEACNYTVTYVDSRSGSCQIDVVRTFTVTDDCGNTSSDIQTISLGDTVDPILTIPASTTIESCDGLSALSDYSASLVFITNDSVAYGFNVIEACNYFVSYIDTRTGTCPLVITRTFTVEDACGYSDTKVQTITITDTALPTITAPATANVEGCDITALTDYSENPIDVTSNAGTYGYTASDNCDFTVTYVDSQTGTCPIVVTRVFTITDDCGNSVSDNQTINVGDTVAPTITAPASINIEACDVTGLSDYSETPVDITTDAGTYGYAATDACGFTVTYVDSQTGTCPIVVTRIFTAIDACGNSAAAPQTINISDTSLPTITAPAAANIEACDITGLADYSETSVDITTDAVTYGYAVSDACNVTVAYVDSQTGTCPIVVTRVFTVTDACGNAASANQTINIEDTVLPTITAPATNDVEGCDITALTDYSETSVDVTADAATYGYTVSDACNVTIAYVDSQTGTCPIVVTRVFTVTDACGNSASANQTINVGDTTAPVPVSPPGDESYQCASDVPLMGDLTANDLCDGIVLQSSTTELINPGSSANNYTIDRTWTFTDACMNTEVVTQTITVLDDTDPTISCPSDIVTNTCDDMISIPVPTFNDNCTGATIMNDFNNTADASGIYPVGVTTVIWTVTDLAGNTATCSMTVTVNTIPTAFLRGN